LHDICQCTEPDYIRWRLQRAGLPAGYCKSVKGKRRTSVWWGEGRQAGAAWL